ncbi:hypothetical protein [Desulfoferrobacter suflitae]|uniref:hypothetical protein n=1 Tax=Desulfoferrobacter suflitae TaxID=2865782 RepID=UPI0021642E8F|nr:hypothetical protein [Desulfoferrobacter suflitae]MCK8600768.1 hypothetical protein [Desulfoferrobacter suflitae]
MLKVETGTFNGREAGLFPIFGECLPMVDVFFKWLHKAVWMEGDGPTFAERNVFDSVLAGEIQPIPYKEKFSMTNIMPEGEAIRKAVKWISAELDEEPEKSLLKLVNEAVQRFDLSPKEAEFLIEFYRQSKASLNHD